MFFYFQELFLQSMAKDAYNYTQQTKRKTVQRKDMGEYGHCITPTIILF